METALYTSAPTEDQMTPSTRCGLHGKNHVNINNTTGRMKRRTSIHSYDAGGLITSVQAMNQGLKRQKTAPNKKSEKESAAHYGQQLHRTDSWKDVFLKPFRQLLSVVSNEHGLHDKEILAETEASSTA